MQSCNNIRLSSRFYVYYNDQEHYIHLFLNTFNKFLLIFVLFVCFRRFK